MTVLSQLKNLDKKNTEELHHTIYERHVAKRQFSILKNWEIEEFLDDVEEHNTLDRDEDREEEVIDILDRGKTN